MARTPKNGTQKGKVLPLVRIEESDRLKLLLAASEARRLQVESELAVAQADKLVAELDKDGRVRAALEQANKARSAGQFATQKYLSVMKGVEEKLGHSLEGYAMDPETGVVRPLSSTSPGAAVHSN